MSGGQVAHGCRALGRFGAHGRNPQGRGTPGRGQSPPPAGGVGAGHPAGRGADGNQTMPNGGPGGSQGNRGGGHGVPQPATIDTGNPNLRRGGGCGQGVGAGVGVLRLSTKTRQVVLRWSIPLVMLLSWRILHSRPSRSGSARTRQISSWIARFARRTTTLASARSLEGLSRPFHIAEPLPMG
jgi:hypothetical protein